MAEQAAPPKMEVKPTSSKKKMILIIAAAALVLVVVGGGLFLFRHSLFGSSESDTQAKSEATALKKGAAVSGQDSETAKAKRNTDKKKKSADVAALLVLEPFTVNLQDPEGNRYMRLVLHLGTKTEVSAKAAENPIVKAKIRNAIIRYLCTLTAEEVLSKDGKEKLITNVIESTNAILDEDSVVEVFIIDLIVQ